MIWVSTRCRVCQLPAAGSQWPVNTSMTFISIRFSLFKSSLFKSVNFFFLLLIAAFAVLSPASSLGQLKSSSADVSIQSPGSVPAISGSTIALRAVSTTTLVSEAGGAFMVPAKCDGNGNLYIRKFAMDRPLLGPVVRIDTDGKRTALFDAGSFSQLGIDRADAFSPGSDGGLYQIAESGRMGQGDATRPHIYVLHFSSDGSASTPILLDADLEVYTFATFADGNFLVSGVQRSPQSKDNGGRNFTAVFSADGREVAQLRFQKPAADVGKSDSKAAAPGAKQIPSEAEKAGPVLDLADAEVGSDGFLYVMRGSSPGSSPVVIYVIASSGKIMKTIKVTSPLASGRASGFHVSANRLAVSFEDEEERGAMVVADAQTGRNIASYEDPGELGPTFACYAADENMFTFLKLGDGNSLEVVRAEPQ